MPTTYKTPTGVEITLDEKQNVINDTSKNYPTGGMLPGSDVKNQGKPGYDVFGNPVRTAGTPRVDPATVTGTAGAASSGFTKPSFNSLSDYQSYLRGTPEEQGKIAAQFEADVRAQNDLINATYDKFKADQTTINTNEEGRARALISSGQYGGTGGTGAVAKTNTTEKVGADKLANIEAQRLAKMQVALSQLTAARNGREDKEANRRATELNQYETYAKKNQDSALAGIKSFAEGKGDLETLKQNEPNTYQTMLDSFDGSEMKLDAYIESNKPKAERIEYKEKIYKGPDGNAHIYRYGTDPITGAEKHFDESTGINFEDFTSAVTDKPILQHTGDGGLVAVSPKVGPDGNYKVQPIGGPKPIKPPVDTKPKKSGNLSYTGADISEGAGYLEKSRGEDGFASATIYNAMYKAWVDRGGLITDFIKLYPPAKYVNPSDENILPQLRKSAPSVEGKG